MIIAQHTRNLPRAVPVLPQMHKACFSLTVDRLGLGMQKTVHAQLDGSISLALRSRKDFVDAAGNPIIPPPSGTAGVTLKKLTVDFAVPIPELVEAVLPAKLK